MKLTRLTAALAAFGVLPLAHANTGAPPESDSSAFAKLVARAKQRHDGVPPPHTVEHRPATPSQSIVHAPAPPPAPASEAPAPVAHQKVVAKLRPWLELAPIEPPHHASTTAHAPSASTPQLGRVTEAPPIAASPSPHRAAMVKLLASKRRPTPAEVVQAVREANDGKLPKENPFGSTSVLGKQKAVAEMVAQLEHAFPGGTWLPLGRDAVLIADLLEGFYTSIGQPQRVRRLDASGNSFPHYRSATEKTYEEDRPTIYGFLKSNGLDLDNVDKQPPYIMIDVTGYSPTSQSTQLVRSVYRTWAERGRDPKALYDRVNFVGISGSGISIDTASDLAADKARLKAEVTKDGPGKLLYLGSSATSGLTYTSVWHMDFEKFTSDGKGGITAPLGPPVSEGQRKQVLAELYDAATLTSSSALLEEVKRVARDKYHYEFPMTQTEKLVRHEPPKAVKPSVVVAASVTTSTPTAATSSAGDRPMKAFLSALTDRMLLTVDRGEIATDFLGDLAGMWARGSITRDELREGVRTIQRWEPNLEPSMKHVAKSHPDFGKDVAAALADKSEAKAATPSKQRGMVSERPFLRVLDKWREATHERSAAKKREATEATLIELAEAWTAEALTTAELRSAVVAIDNKVPIRDLWLVLKDNHWKFIAPLQEAMRWKAVNVDD